MGLLALLRDKRKVYQRTSVMAEDLSDLEIAVLCDLLEGHGANLNRTRRLSSSS